MNRAERARERTDEASRAQLFDNLQPIVFLDDGMSRAYRQAGRAFALAACHRCRDIARFDESQPRRRAECKLPMAFAARNDAGVAPDTSMRVDDDEPVHANLTSLTFPDTPRKEPLRPLRADGLFRTAPPIAGQPVYTAVSSEPHARSSANRAFCASTALRAAFSASAIACLRASVTSTATTSSSEPSPSPLSAASPIGPS